MACPDRVGVERSRENDLPSKESTVIETAMHRDSFDDIDPDRDFEPVEVAADYHAEMSVPFTPDQLTAVSRIARERGVSPPQAAQDLIAQALSAD
jgi:hypothetical protein